MEIKIESTAIQLAKSDELDRLSHDYLGVKQSLDDTDYGCRMGDDIALPEHITATDGVYSDTQEAFAEKGSTITPQTEGNVYQRILDENVKKVLATNMYSDEDADIKASDFEALTSIGTWFQNKADIINFSEFNRANITSINVAGTFEGCTNLESVGCNSSGVCYMKKLKAHTWYGYAFRTQDTKLKAFFLPKFSTLGGWFLTGNISNMRVLDIGKNMTSYGGYIIANYINSNSQNIVIMRSPTLPTGTFSNGNFYGKKFVPESAVTDGYYAIGGEEWVEVFGSTDEYADVAMYAPDDYDEIVAAYEEA